jgi:hypothetical protein
MTDSPKIDMRAHCDAIAAASQQAVASMPVGRAIQLPDGVSVAQPVDPSLLKSSDND